MLMLTEGSILHMEFIWDVAPNSIRQLFGFSVILEYSACMEDTLIKVLLSNNT